MAWVLADVALVPLSPMMAAHHVIVVVGSWLALALARTQAATSLFAGAMTLLELGSATVNVMGLLDTRATRLAVLVGITTSNVFGGLLAAAWVRHVQPAWATRVAVAGMLASLLVGREWQAMLVWTSRARVA